MSYAGIVHTEDFQRVADEVAIHSQNNETESFTQEYRILTADGMVIWTDDRTWIIRDDTGTITHYQGVVMDINDRKQAEKELKQHRDNLEELVSARTSQLTKAKEEAELAGEAFRQQRDILNTLMETIPSPLFYKDVHGRYTGCNPAFENLSVIPEMISSGKLAMILLHGK